MGNRIDIRGFTLIEVLVVMGLAAILIFFAWPSIPFESPASKARRATVKLISSLREIRNEANLTGLPQALQFSSSQQTVDYLSAQWHKGKTVWQRKNRLELPSELRLESVVKLSDSGLQKPRNNNRVACYANDVCQSAIVNLTAGQRKFSLWVQPFTERITIFERHYKLPVKRASKRF